MNILVVAHRVPFPPNKGEKIRTFYQIKHLVQSGHKVSVACLVESAEDEAHLQTLREQYCDSVYQASLPGKLAWPKAFLHAEPVSVANFYNRRLQKQIDKAIMEENIDVILCTSSSLADYVFKSLAVKRMNKRPALLMDFMDLDSDKWRQYAEQSSFPKSSVYSRESKLLAVVERRVCKHFDAAFFISQNEVELMRARSDSGYSNVHVIANGIDAEEFAPLQTAGGSVENKEAPVFLFTGVMDYLPNEDAVCWFAEKVWPSIITTKPAARFQIVGMSPSDRVIALGSQPGIEVTGKVDDIVVYYQRADIFVAPFRLARGVQNKVLQAFASALPVVATPMACEGIAVSRGVDVLIADDEHDFLSQSLRLIDQPSERSALGAAARNLVLQDYAWASCLRPLDRLLLQFQQTTRKHA